MKTRKQPTKTKRPPSDVLRHQYHSERMTSSQLAQLYDADPQTILNWMKSYGIERRPIGSCPGDMNPSWKGGRNLDKNGYVLVHDPEHPNARKNGYILEHRKVMAEEIGRPLTRKEVVHHVDADKQKNDPGNLHLYGTNAEHLRDELTNRVPNWSEAGKAALAEVAKGQRKNTWTNERRQAQRERLAVRRSNGDQFGKYEWSDAMREAARQRMIVRMASKKQ